MKALALITTGLFAISSLPNLAEDNFHYDYATVMQSKPVYRIVEVTSEERRCQQLETRYQQPVRNSANNSLIGGILGAAVGHALGHRSKHRAGTTVAGAIVGASLASDNGRTVTRTKLENHCKMVPTSWEEERIIGYNVVYRYNDRTFETRLPFEPGDSLKIRVLLSPMPESNG